MLFFYRNKFSRQIQSTLSKRPPLFKDFLYWVTMMFTSQWSEIWCYVNWTCIFRYKLIRVAGTLFICSHEESHQTGLTVKKMVLTQDCYSIVLWSEFIWRRKGILSLKHLEHDCNFKYLHSHGIRLQWSIRKLWQNFPMKDTGHCVTEKLTLIFFLTFYGFFFSSH